MKLDRAQIEILINYHKDELSKLNEKVVEVTKKIRVLESELSDFQDFSSGSSIEFTSSKAFNTRKMIMEELTNESRFLTTKELAQIAVEKYGQTHNSKLNNSISTNLASYKNIGKLINYSIGSQKDKYWGFKEWLDENDKPKEEHKPKNI